MLLFPYILCPVGTTTNEITIYNMQALKLLKGDLNYMKKQQHFLTHEGNISYQFSYFRFLLFLPMCSTSLTPLTRLQCEEGWLEKQEQSMTR